MDRSTLAATGVRPTKQILSLVVCSALRKKDCEWAHLYERLLPRMCAYDEAVQAYRGKKRVIGRIAGQIAAQVYALLKTDHELLSQLAPGKDPPAPLLYDPKVNKRHREGGYQPLKPSRHKQELW